MMLREHTKTCNLLIFSTEFLNIQLERLLLKDLFNILVNKIFLFLFESETINNKIYNNLTSVC